MPDQQEKIILGNGAAGSGSGWKGDLLVYGTISLALFLTQLPAAGEVLNYRVTTYEEIEMTFSVLDRFLGLPSTSLAWPGGTLQFFALPAVIGDYLLHPAFPKSLPGLTRYLSVSYRDPWHSVLLVRLVVCLVTSLGFCGLFFAVKHQTRSLAAAVAAPAVLASIPVLWIKSHSAINDSFALGMACAAIALLPLVKSRRETLVVIGLFTGAAIASKITAASLCPFIAGLCLDRTNKPLRTLLLLGFSIGAGFLIFCPYIWTDPFRMAKSMLGNAGRPGNPLGLFGGILLLHQSLPGWMPAALAVAITTSLAGKRWGGAGGAMVSAAMVLIPAARAGTVFPRYLVPLAVPATYLAVVESTLLIAALRTRLAPGRGRWLPAGLIAAGLIAVLANLRGFPKARREFQENFAPKIAPLQRLPHSQTVILDNKSLVCASQMASSESLLRLAANAQAVFFNPEWLHRFVPEAKARQLRPFLSGMNEDLEVYIARLQIMALTPGANDLDLWLWGQKQVPQRFNIMTQEEAIAMFKEGRARVLVLFSEDESLGPYSNYGYRRYIYDRGDRDGLRQGRRPL